MTNTQIPTPRRPLVPSPSVQGTAGGSGIAERAIALREQLRAPGGGGAGLTWTPSQEEYASLMRAHSSVAPGPVGKIAGAIAEIMSKVGTIKKTGYNAFHKYRYVRMEDMLEVITPLMGAAGLAVIQNEIEVKSIEGNRVAVVYEFSIFHKSGEIWHERARHTGMATARDSKGNWDDKAISKAHTNARKYFFLALFNIPAGDFEDVDADANQRQEQRPVPAPKKQETQPTSREAAPEEPKGPHKIVLGQGAGADQWAGAYIKAIEKAKSEHEIKEWDSANDETLQAVSDRYSEVYQMIEAAVKERLQQLGATGPSDLQERMNWIATTLQGFKDYKEAEDWWNKQVAPHESEFDLPDWEMLMKEWQRTEERLASPT